MTSVIEIGRAVAHLSDEDYASFKASLEAFEAERFDRRIEDDAGSGKLDRLADEGLRDLRGGRTREL